MTEKPTAPTGSPLIPVTPSTIDVLRHIRRTYGLDDPKCPLETITKELDALIGVMEMYE